MVASSVKRYFIKLAYNGHGYFGWQIQKNAITVQEKINEALSTILRHDINVVGCGRTDTGVHAKEFFAHFEIDKQLANSELNTIAQKLNAYLPNDITVFSLFPVDAKAHARFDAISRTYQYIISKRKDPFNFDFSYHFNFDLNIEKMNDGAKIIMEYTDFTSFSKVKTQVKTNNCKISQAYWSQEGHLLTFTITADRFLRNMVRAIVGTLLDLGQDKISLDDLKTIIESKNRSNAGYSVPARGLFLTQVCYPEGLLSIPNPTIS
ncbi:MAG: tRNA pseudouridine(38-40) synthase TruA [Bacteroidales bacterium]